jgi:two-component system sensor histidine kinase BaeS
VVERIGQITGERVILADEEGQIIADSAGELIGQPVGGDWDTQAAQIIHHGTEVGVLYTDFLGRDVDPKSKALPDSARVSPPPPPGVDPGSMVFLASVNRVLLLIAVVAGLGAMLLILGLSRRILAPVEALTAAVRRMEAGDLSQRVEVTSRDEIGELARAFNAMADGLARLEELRRNMVTDVAHELRTPLSNIRGYLEALQDGVIEPKKRIIDSLHGEAMLLNHLVDDLQDLSLAEAGHLKLERQPVALADIVDRAVEAVRPRAEAERVTVQVDLPEDLLVDVDPQRIGQVLRNLLDNALTYTPPGGEVGVAAHGDDQWVEVSVRDTGSGIAAKDLPYVFERFYRADKSRSRATGGTGLGLAIARQLVEAHGGRIWVESTEREGSTFTFALPTSINSQEKIR